MRRMSAICSSLSGAVAGATRRSGCQSLRSALIACNEWHPDIGAGTRITPSAREHGVRAPGRDLLRARRDRGLIGGVALAGELGADVTTVDGVIVGTHTGHVGGANGGSTTVYYVDVERQDTFEQDSVRNARFYDAYQASHDPHVTLEIRATGPDVERIAAAHYLGHTYDATTKAEGVGVAIAFLVLSAVFLALAIRRVLVRATGSLADPDDAKRCGRGPRTTEVGCGTTVAETVIVRPRSAEFLTDREGPQRRSAAGRRERGRGRARPPGTRRTTRSKQSPPTARPLEQGRRSA